MAVHVLQVVVVEVVLEAVFGVGETVTQLVVELRDQPTRSSINIAMPSAATAADDDERADHPRPQREIPHCSTRITYPKPRTVWISFGPPISILRRR